jgi:hypothetical protein
MLHLRGGRCKGSHPGLEETPPELEGIFPHKHHVNCLSNNLKNSLIYF